MVPSLKLVPKVESATASVQPHNLDAADVADRRLGRLAVVVVRPVDVDGTRKPTPSAEGTPWVLLDRSLASCTPNHVV
jgi:hypothetical protein